MKKIFLPLVILMLPSPVFAQTVTVTAPHGDEDAVLPVAFAELSAGQNQAAVAKLTDNADLDARDPSRLINLGTAYARLGRTDQAEKMYRAAISSPIRYDLQLANGNYMDSRWAARTALGNLKDGTPLLALAR